jgi:hypothetical protein
VNRHQRKHLGRILAGRLISLTTKLDLAAAALQRLSDVWKDMLESIRELGAALARVLPVLPWRWAQLRRSVRSWAFRLLRSRLGLRVPLDVRYAAWLVLVACLLASQAQAQSTYPARCSSLSRFVTSEQAGEQRRVCTAAGGGSLADDPGTLARGLWLDSAERRSNPSPIEAATPDDGNRQFLTDPFLGPADWSSPASASTPAHAAVRVRSAVWDGAAYRVEVGVARPGPTELTLLLWCDLGGAMAGRIGSYQAIASPLGVVTLTAVRQPQGTGPCTAAVTWRTTGAGPWVGKRWPAPAPSLSPVAKARPTTAAAAAQPAEYVASLPYRIRMDPNYAPRVSALEVCYLSGATTRPNGRNDTPISCPDPRPTVDVGVWCSALRFVPADQDVPAAVVAAIKAAGACR